MQIRTEKEQERFLRKLSGSISASQPVPKTTTKDFSLPQYKFKGSWPGKVYTVARTCLYEPQLVGTELERRRTSCLVSLFHRQTEQGHCVSLAGALVHPDFLNVISAAEMDYLRKLPEQSLLGPIYNERGVLLKTSFVVWTAIDERTCHSTSASLPKSWQFAPVTKEQSTNTKPISLVERLNKRGAANKVVSNTRLQLRNSILFLVVGTTLLLFGQKFWQNFTSHEETDNAKIQGHIHEIDSRISGTVSSVLVNDNEFVYKGQPLVVLDLRDNEVKVDQAQTALNTALQACSAAQISVSCSIENALAEKNSALGNIAAAKAAVNNSKAAVSTAEVGVALAQSHQSETEAVLRKTHEDYERCNNLNREGITSARDLNSARAAFQIAEAQKTALENEVAQAQSKLIEAKEALAEKQGQLNAASSALNRASSAQMQIELSNRQHKVALSAVQQAEVNLREAKLAESYTRIVAPADGRIAHRTIEVGKRIQPGQCVMSVVEPEFWITANFKETQIERLHPGQSVAIRIDAFPGHVFNGHLDSISPASTAQFAMINSDNATGNFTKIVQRVPAKILLDLESMRGCENRITPGMSAVVSVNLGEAKHHGT